MLRPAEVNDKAYIPYVPFFTPITSTPIGPPNKNQRREEEKKRVNMCRYYAHRHACNHTQFAFAAFCEPASLVQNPCGERYIWATIGINEPCDVCRAAMAGSGPTARE